MTYLPEMSSDFVPYLFRGLMHVGIQYIYYRDDSGGKVDVGDLANNRFLPPREQKLIPPTPAPRPLTTQQYSSRDNPPATAAFPRRRRRIHT